MKSVVFTSRERVKKLPAAVAPLIDQISASDVPRRPVLGDFVYRFAENGLVRNLVLLAPWVTSLEEKGGPTKTSKNNEPKGSPREPQGYDASTERTAERILVGP